MLYETAHAGLERQKEVRQEILNKKLQGELIDLNDAQAEISAMLARARDAWMRVPDKAAIDLPAQLRPDALANWRRLITDVLTDMANWSKRVGKKNV